MKKENSILTVAKVFELHKEVCDDLEIADAEEASVDAEERRFADFCRRMKVASFSDLQLLRILPDNIEENRLVAAIVKDDEQAYEIARKNYNLKLQDCDCHGSSMNLHNTMNAAYKGIRKECNFNLANVLSEAYNQRLNIASPVVRDAYKWTSAVSAKFNIDILAYLVRDIIVNYNSTLSVKPNVKYLLARNVIIKRGGKIVAHPSHLRIRCSSIQGNVFLLGKDQIEGIEVKNTK